MKFTRTDIFAIAKAPYELAGDKSNRNIDYLRWVEFIDNHPKDFIWYEKTKSGIEVLTNIDKVPNEFKERVLIGLNKCSCFKEFDNRKGYYNIHAGFNFTDDIVSIGFERTPKLEDLKIFVEMAKYLDALLLVDGTRIIDEKMTEDQQ